MRKTESQVIILCLSNLIPVLYQESCLQSPVLSYDISYCDQSHRMRHNVAQNRPGFTPACAQLLSLFLQTQPNTDQDRISVEEFSPASLTYRIGLKRKYLCSLEFNTLTIYLHHTHHYHPP